MILADLDPELHGLPPGIPAGVSGKVKEDPQKKLASWQNTPYPKYRWQIALGVNG